LQGSARFSSDSPNRNRCRLPNTSCRHTGHKRRREGSKKSDLGRCEGKFAASRTHRHCISAPTGIRHKSALVTQWARSLGNQSPFQYRPRLLVPTLSKEWSFQIREQLGSYTFQFPLSKPVAPSRSDIIARLAPIQPTKAAARDPVRMFVASGMSAPRSRPTLRCVCRHSTSRVGAVQEGIASKLVSIGDGVCLAGMPQPPPGEVQEDKSALRVGGAVSRLNALLRSRSTVFPRSQSHPHAKHMAGSSDDPRTKTPSDSNYDERAGIGRRPCSTITPQALHRAAA
jgi:hypothetical protein